MSQPAITRTTPANREFLHQEVDALRAESASGGGQLGGAALNALAEQTEARYVRLREALPAGYPDDWRLVTRRASPSIACQAPIGASAP